MQYPGVAKSIESDVDNLATAFGLARLLPQELDLDPIVAEAKRQLRVEADYQLEAAALRRYGQLLVSEPACVVPGVIDAWSTRRVLAMDRVPGLPLEDLAGPDHDPAERNRVVTCLYRILFRELFEWRYCQTDPNLANYLYDPQSGAIGLLDLGSTREVPEWLSSTYREIFRAGIRRDREALRSLALEVGFVNASDPRESIELVVEMMELGCEPFREDGYDCGGSDLAKRLRDIGFDLTFGHGFMRPPPAETMFLHRKMGGTFLLAARLKAVIPGRSLIGPFLDGTD